MRKNLWLILVLFVLASVSLLAVSVHDIQYTTNAGDGTYPSPLNGQVVTLNNVIVIAKGYSGGTYVSTRWFVSDVDGGPWSGIYLYDTTNAGSVNVGDIINVTGTVSEYNGLTEFSYLSGIQVLSSGNVIPAPVTITTGMMTQPALIEPYESCLVQVLNVRVVSAPSATYFEWDVTDQPGYTNLAQIDDGFIIGFAGLNPLPIVGATYVKIRGIVDYSGSSSNREYGINPRFLTDIIQEVTVETAQVSISQSTSPVNNFIKVPIITTALDPNFNVKKFSFALKYDPLRLEILGAFVKNTILETTGIDSLIILDSLHIDQDSEFANTLYVSFESDSLLTSSADGDTLIFLSFRTKSYGPSPLTLFDFKYNNTTLNAVTSGFVNIPVAKVGAYMNIYNPSYSSDKRYKLNHFNPSEGKIRISFGGKTNGHSTTFNFKGIIRIYDSQGRLVNTIFNQVINTPTGVTYIDWDGRNSEMNMVPIGLYYCHAEIIDRESGDRNTVVQPIVVGKPLK